MPALTLTHAVVLAAVADRDEGRCARLAPGIPSYRSAEALFAAEEVGALVLATPAETHLADARAAAARGVTLLVEKPPAPDAGGAAELPRSGRSRGSDSSDAFARSSQPFGRRREAHRSRR